SAFTSDDNNLAESFRIKFIGSNGSVKALMGEMKNVAPENKREMGKVLNELKVLAESKYEALKSSSATTVKEKNSPLDLTLPGEEMAIGTRHPISIVKNQIVSIFQRLGFAVAEGPEIE